MSRVLAIVITLLALMISSYSSARAGVVKPEDCPAGAAPGCPCNGFDGNDDSGCWQWALDQAKPQCAPPITPFPTFGAVVGTPNAHYFISQTLRVNTAFGGVIDGNGAALEWMGLYDPATNQSPMWLLEDTQQLKITNMMIVSSIAHRLVSAFEFTNGPDPAAPCIGIFPTANILDHISISPNDTLSLDYGVRFSNRYLNDQGNDESTIMNSTINNVMRAAISIEHSQSHQHRFYAVNASGALGHDLFPGNESYCASENGDPSPTVCGASFVRLKAGGFTSIGGYRNAFKNAEFYIVGMNTPVTIIDTNSENCARFIKTPSGIAYPMIPVNVYGGRFGDGGLSTDGHVIDWYRPGPLVVRGMEIESAFPPPPGSPNPIFYLAPPGRDPQMGTSNFEGQFEISDNSFYRTGSTEFEPVVLAPNTSTPITARLVSHGNMCLNPQNGPAPCRGAAAGIESSSGLPFAQLAALAVLDGHTTFCSDCTPHTSPCAGNGTGMMATHQIVNGISQWDCGGGVVLSSDSTVTYDSEWNTTAAINTRTADDDFVTLAGAQTISGAKILSNDLTTSDGRLTSSKASAPGNVALDLRNTFSGSNSDRYLLKLRKGLSTDFLYAREDGLIYTTGGLYTGGITSTLWPTVGNAFYKGFTGTVSGYTNNALRIQAESYANAGSDGEILGADLLAVWQNAGTATTYPSMVGGRFENYMGKSSSSLMTQVGGDFRTYISAPAGATVTNQYAGYFYRQYNNVANVISSASSLYLASPCKLDANSFCAGSAAVITENYGLWIADQKGYGMLNDAAIRVDSQSGGTGAKGNVWLAGGTWNTGHHRLEDAHVFWDTSRNVLRVKDSAAGPTTDADGNAIVMGTGSDSHGVLLWGSSDSNFNTGDKVCNPATPPGGVGMTCVTTYTTGGQNKTCSNVFSTYFFALCK